MRIFESRTFVATGFGAFLLWGAVLCYGMEFSTEIGGTDPLQFGSQLTAVRTVPPDTAHPIPTKPCSVDTSYRTVQLYENEITDSYRSMGHYVAPSLHDLTCRWAQSYGHSTDPGRLPKYVQPTGDSLRLTENALLYIVRMVPPSGKDKKAYLVAEIGDSLSYTHAHTGKELRALREVEVPGTDTRYIWLEYVDPSSDSTMVRWRGHIFTYDRERGIVQAARAPVRFELFEDGESLGYNQLDVSIPQPGIMKIEPRAIPDSNQLTSRQSFRSNFHKWIGVYVIDATETNKRNLNNRHGRVAVKSTEATEWDRKTEHVFVLPPDRFKEQTNP